MPPKIFSVLPLECPQTATQALLKDESGPLQKPDS